MYSELGYAPDDYANKDNERQKGLYRYTIVPQGTMNINVASMPGLPCLSDESSQKLLKTTLAWYTFCTAYPTHANLSNGTTAHTHTHIPISTLLTI